MPRPEDPFCRHSGNHNLTTESQAKDIQRWEQKQLQKKFTQSYVISYLVLDES